MGPFMIIGFTIEFFKLEGKVAFLIDTFMISSRDSVMYEVYF
jgi:hypothetical protein